MNKKQNMRLNGVIAKYAAMDGVNSRIAQAERARISYPCYRRRVENIGLFTLDELDRVVRTFGIPWNEIMEALQ